MVCDEHFYPFVSEAVWYIVYIFCCLGNCHIAYHLYSTAFEHDVESCHIFRCAGPRPIR